VIETKPPAASQRQSASPTGPKQKEAQQRAQLIKHSPANLSRAQAPIRLQPKNQLDRKP
jgi:hypothetical protein